MTTAESTGAPIYDGLVEERGDVPAEARTVAEQALRSAEEAVDFSALRGAPA